MFFAVGVVGGAVVRLARLNFFFNTWQQVTADSGRACDTTAANINKYPGYDGPHVTSGNLVSKKDQ